MTVLTVIVPCFNRHEMLKACIDSMQARARELIEVVLVDDGSEPPLESVTCGLLGPAVKVLRQANRGRSAALRAGILNASGDYILIMDSDDEFIDGALDRIVADLACLSPSLVGIAYECIHFDTGTIIAALADDRVATLLELRADHGIRGDLKEVIRSSIVKASLYADPGQERRVPTSYIWAGVSSSGPVITRAAPVVRHRYLADGMTRSIASLKRQNPFWLARTYLRVATAPRDAYRSAWYRFIHGVKALAVPGSGLGTDDKRRLRASLGLSLYVVAVLGAFLLRMGRHR